MNFQCWHDGQWKMVLKSVACCFSGSSFRILYNLFCWIWFHTWNLDDILFPRGWSLHRYIECSTQVAYNVTAYFGFCNGPAWSNTKRVWKQAPMKEELQICIKIKDCIAISAFFLHLWESPSLHVQCSRLNVPGVCCCIQSYGLMSSQRWVEGKVAVPTPGSWCALCAQGAFVSVRIYRATSWPVPQSILPWPWETHSSCQNTVPSLCSFHCLSAFQQRVFQSSPRFPPQLSFSGLNRNQTDLAWQKRSHSYSSAETQWFKFLPVPQATPSLSQL